MAKEHERDEGEVIPFVGELRYYSSKRGGVTHTNIREAAERDGIALWQAKIALEERTAAKVQQWNGEWWVDVPYVCEVK